MCDNNRDGEKLINLEDRTNRTVLRLNKGSKDTQ